jgi:hypothetical protein
MKSETVRCRKCNQSLQGMCYNHICPKEFNKAQWRTKINTSHGRTERRQERLDYMIEHPKKFKMIKHNI